MRKKRKITITATAMQNTIMVILMEVMVTLTVRLKENQAPRKGR